VTGPFHPVPQLVHPLLGLPDFQRDPELPLEVHDERGPIPLHPREPKGLRRLLQMDSQRGSDLGRQAGRSSRPRFGPQRLEPRSIDAMNPSGQTHARQPQDLGNPARALPFQQQQQRGDLDAHPGARDLPGQGDQLCLRGVGVRQLQRRGSHTPTVQWEGSICHST